MGITRIYNPPGFLARHYYGKKEPFYEYFYDREYGEEEEARSAAESFLKRAEKEFPKPTPPKRKPGMGRTYDVVHGRRVPCWQVFWTSYPDKKKHTKKFYFSNDIEERESERKARIFLKAREIELEKQAGE